MITLKDIKYTKQRKALDDYTSFQVTEYAEPALVEYNKGYDVRTELCIWAQSETVSDHLRVCFDHQAEHIINVIYGDIRRELGELQHMLHVGSKTGAMKVTDRLIDLIEKSYGK